MQGEFLGTAPAGAAPKKVVTEYEAPRLQGGACGLKLSVKTLTSRPSRRGLRQRETGDVYGFGKPSIAFSARAISSSGSA
jgi:hypothetical protein